MCGRYVITSPPDAVRALFGYAEQPNFPPRYNVAPTQPIPLVRLDDGKRSFALMRWGLLPAWVKDPKTFSLLVNARGESVLEKPAFRNAMRRRRCLVPADGFYEWAGRCAEAALFRAAEIRRTDRFCRPMGDLDRPERRRSRHRRHRHHEGEPHARRDPRPHAGHRGAGGVRSLARLRQSRRHDRRRADRAGAESLLECYEISPAVNRVANDSAELIAPAAAGGAVQLRRLRRPRRRKPKKQNDQPSLF